MSVDLKKVALIYLRGRMLRVATQFGPLRRALMEKMSFQYLHTGRTRKDYYNETVACYSIKSIDGVPHLVAPSGFLESIMDICGDHNIPFKLIDVEEDAIIEDPWYCPPMNLKIPKREWEAARNWQKEAVRIMNSYSDGRFCIATGGGKTRLITDLCRWLPNDRILITAKSRTLCDDLHRKITEAAGNVGIHHSQMKAPSGRILVCSSGSLEHYADKEWDLFIADELHELLTPSGVKALASVRAKRAYGFSGSIGDRSDGADLWGEAFFGPLRLERKYQDVQSDKDVVPILVHWIDLPSIGHYITPFKQSDRARVFLWRNKVRNEAFAAQARYHHDKGRQVLVLTKTTEHALIMGKILGWPVVANPPSDLRRKTFLKEKLLEPGQLEDKKQIMELQKAFERREIRGIVANCIWQTGKDFPSLDVLCRMDGESTEIRSTQIPGRLARKFPGKEFGLLIDCRDNFERACKRRASRRASSYASRGWRNATASEIETGHLSRESVGV